MSPLVYIAERQYAWARRHGIIIDEAGYVASLNDNLFLPLTPGAILEYQAGRGHELARNMRAVHSSSALVANVFNYWRLYSDLGPIVSAICPTLASSAIQDVSFEAQAPIDWPIPPQGPTISPHLDVIIRYQDQVEPGVTKAIAIESKYGEIYGQDQGKFADRYLAPENREMWAGLDPLREVATQIHRGEIVFQRLKVAQLIKHILGLRSIFLETQNFDLVYLWYPAPGAEAAFHQDEIHRFQRLTNACRPRVRFRGMAYHDLIHTLALSQGNDHGAYIDYLQERYF